MNGIIVLDKPEGKTSHDMVNFVRRLTGVRRVGHTGTLDPMATGVLPICVGSAAKVSDMLTATDKRYTAELLLGVKTDTEDISGNVIEKNDVSVSRADIENAVKEFVGKISQIPPMYSAIKQNGKKLYELARQGIEVERNAREVTIYSIDILDITEKTIKIDVNCSKGTYIRTLCADIGNKLGTGACMTSLRRTAAGIFTIENAYTPAELENERGKISDLLMPPDEIFAEYPPIYLNEKQTRSIVNGVRMTWRDGVENQCYRLYGENREFLCVSRCVEGKLRLEKSFWT